MASTSLLAGIDHAWLATGVEPIIAPELPICDPHHHIFVRPDYDYLLPSLTDDLNSGHRIVSTVYANGWAFYRDSGPEELRPVGEVETIRALTEPLQRTGQRIAAGIIGFADLALGARAEPVIATLVAAGGGRLKGVRQSAASDARLHFADREHQPADLYDRAEFRAGFAHLHGHGLVFDAFVYDHQLPMVARLARDFPEQAIVVDHMGGILGTGPYQGQRKQRFALWAEGIAALGHCPNVVMKMSGMGSKRCGFDWHLRPVPPTAAELAAAWQPYVETCLEHLGPERCMFASNFPIDKVSFSYAAFWNACKLLTVTMTHSERLMLLHGTASKAYGLGEEVCS